MSISNLRLAYYQESKEEKRSISEQCCCVKCQIFLFSSGQIHIPLTSAHRRRGEIESEAFLFALLVDIRALRDERIKLKNNHSPKVESSIESTADARKKATTWWQKDLTDIRYCWFSWLTDEWIRHVQATDDLFIWSTVLTHSSSSRTSITMHHRTVMSSIRIPFDLTKELWTWN